MSRVATASWLAIMGTGFFASLVVAVWLVAQMWLGNDHPHLPHLALNLFATLFTGELVVFLGAVLWDLRKL